MRPLKMLIAATAVALAGAAAMPALADDASPGQGGWGPSGMMGMMGPWMMGQGGGMPGMMGWAGHGKAMCTAMASHIDGRLAFARAELKITPEQETLWNAYAASARDNATAMSSHCASMMDRRGNAATSLPERLDQHEQLMASQLDAMRAMNKALKPLYAAMSDSQKKVADQIFWGPMGM